MSEARTGGLQMAEIEIDRKSSGEYVITFKLYDPGLYVLYNALRLYHHKWLFELFEETMKHSPHTKKMFSVATLNSGEKD
jgi:hypothetical protein